MIYIYQDDAFEKMVQVEGEHWKRAQLSPENPFGLVSFAAFKETWYQFYEALKARGEVSSEEEATKVMAGQHDMGISTAEGDGAIYGDGGWTRYTVRYTGEIQFIQAQSPSPECTQRAVEAGFRLF
jgi:hypothetical protein